MMWGYGYTWGGMFAMWLLALIGLGLLALAVWALVRWLARLPALTVPRQEREKKVEERPRDRSAVEILAQRYARGEIDRATYTEMRQQIETTPQRRGELVSVNR